jgi:hypothetical protein
MAIFKQGTIFTHQFPMVTTGGAPAVGVLGSLVVKLGQNGSAGVPATGTLHELDATNLKGVYSIVFSSADVGVLGSLSLVATATGCNQLTEVHQVQGQLFTDMQLTAGGRVSVTSNLIQNTPFTALFFMTQVGTTNPAPGLTVTGQRTFGIGGFGNVSGSIAEVGGANNGGGWYVFSGQAADANAAVAGFKFSATGANDSDFSLWFQP